jgi:hypothetical protein
MDYEITVRRIGVDDEPFCTFIVTLPDPSDEGDTRADAQAAILQAGMDF